MICQKIQLMVNGPEAPKSDAIGAHTRTEARRTESMSVNSNKGLLKNCE